MDGLFDDTDDSHNQHEFGYAAESHLCAGQVAA